MEIEQMTIPMEYVDEAKIKADYCMAIISAYSWREKNTLALTEIRLYDSALEFMDGYIKHRLPVFVYPKTPTPTQRQKVTPNDHSQNAGPSHHRHAD